uniref:Putative conserved secreted protein n=1 Tax=Hyalomma excavatum TaxID=257692 RepID=A0A131XLD9_9ACAR
MDKVKAGCLCVALLAAIAYAKANDKPNGCDRVSSSSFGRESRPPFGLYCERCHNKTHPNRSWLGTNFRKPKCTICCVGKDSSGNIYYNITTLPKKTCRK